MFGVPWPLLWEGHRAHQMKLTCYQSARCLKSHVCEWSEIYHSIPLCEWDIVCVLYQDDLLFIDTPQPPMILQNKANKKWNLEISEQETGHGGRALGNRGEGCAFSSESLQRQEIMSVLS